MPINDNKVVTIHYTLKDEHGDLLETSEGDEPLAYIHGIGNIIPGLELALSGHDVGDRVEVTINPEDGYGERDDERVQVVPRAQFENMDELDVGMQFHAETDRGVEIVTVVKVDGDDVVVDGNHPMAGQTLNFDVRVVAIRDATPEELDHGHVHGPGGHVH
ncbi:MAG: peptidylprolyl isomerase [Chromatiales bacterium]|nr:peptidylprolyl isomerase [Chromatiales bacterium]